MRQCKHLRITSRKSDERDVARRHPVGPQTCRHGNFGQSQPISIAERGADVRPWVDGARCGERHCRVDHRIQALRAKRSGELFGYRRTRARERYTGGIGLVWLRYEFRHLVPILRQHVVECTVCGEAALDILTSIITSVRGEISE